MIDVCYDACKETLHYAGLTVAMPYFLLDGAVEDLIS